MKPSIKATISLSIFTLIFSGCSNSSNLQKTQPESESIYQVNQWNKISEGLEYQPIKLGEKHLTLHVIKIDPTLFDLRIFENNFENNNTKEPETIDQIHKKTGSVFTVNGSFFDENFKPTGLLISAGRILNPLNSNNQSGGFFSINSASKALIHKPTDDWTQIEFAIQNSPILVDQNGEPTFTKETGKRAGRSAIGLDQDNNIVIIVIQENLAYRDFQFSLKELAELLSKNSPNPDLQLHSVLNLDGGPSSGFSLKNISYPELTPVENVIITIPRS